MIFPYKVKHNGILYPAGADVPAGDFPVTETKPIIKQDVVEKEVSKFSNVTKTDIFRMSKVNLVALAKEMGIEGADEMKANALKREINSRL